jgi:hypothetical protein
MRVLKFDRLGADVALRAIGLTSRRMARPKSQGHITIGAIRPLARGAREPGEQLVWHFALGMPGGRALISILSLGIVAPVPEFPRLRRQLPRHDRPQPRFGGAFYSRQLLFTTRDSSVECASQFSRLRLHHTRSGVHST